MADLSRLWVVGCVVFGLGSGACAATIGPYVTDIEEMPDGRWKVTRCTTEVSNIGTSAQGFDQGECTGKIIGQPQPAQPQPVQPQSAQPQSAQPQSAQPQPVQPQSAQPQQGQPR